MSISTASTTARDVAEKTAVAAAAAFPLCDCAICTQLPPPSPPPTASIARWASDRNGPGSRSMSPETPDS